MLREARLPDSRLALSTLAPDDEFEIAHLARNIGEPQRLAEQPAPSASDRPSAMEGAEQNSLMQTLAPGPSTRPLSLLCRRRIPRQFKTPEARCYSRKSESSATGLPHPLMRRIGGLRRGWNPRNKYTQSLAFARIRIRTYSQCALARIRTYPCSLAFARIRNRTHSHVLAPARNRTYSQSRILALDSLVFSDLPGLGMGW